jgi:hypothetical protein
MPTLTEQSLAFHFPENWSVTKYDDWSFYKNQFKDSCLGCKAVDFLAIDPVRKELWLIEVKDYRYFRRTKEDDMWDEMALKVLHTLAGLVTVKMADSDEMNNFAKECLKCVQLKVILHLEQPQKNSKLFPRVYDPANVKQKLRQLIKPIHAHPKVTEMGNMCGVVWKVESVGGRE